jgi:hypothetical protein
MSHFITTFSRYILDIAIGGNWEVLRKRLKKLQKRQPGSGSGSSRPATPSSVAGHEDDDQDYFAFEELDLDDDEEEGVETQQLHQLHSIHSLVLYHHLIMDRILRSCLLHPSQGHQVAFKILMTLFGICLDFAKTVKEVEKGLLGWMDGGRRIEEYWREWVEKETVFVCPLNLCAVLIDSYSPLTDCPNGLLLSKVMIMRRRTMILRCYCKESGTVEMEARGMV